MGISRDEVGVPSQRSRVLREEKRIRKRKNKRESELMVTMRKRTTDTAEAANSSGLMDARAATGGLVFGLGAVAFFCTSCCLTPVASGSGLGELAKVFSVLTLGCGSLDLRGLTLLEPLSCNFGPFVYKGVHQSFFFLFCYCFCRGTGFEF